MILHNWSGTRDMLFATRVFSSCRSRDCYSNWIFCIQFLIYQTAASVISTQIYGFEVAEFWRIQIQVCDDIPICHILTIAPIPRRLCAILRLFAGLLYIRMGVKQVHMAFSREVVRRKSLREALGNGCWSV